MSRLGSVYRDEGRICGAMPHGGFCGLTPEDNELARETKNFVDRHRRRHYPPAGLALEGEAGCVVLRDCYPAFGKMKSERMDANSTGRSP